MQFENALLNLAVNARDAMDGHGSLTIRTLRDEEEEATGLAVQVIDTGCGMAPAVLERVFDPFYTTKPAGKGTGLRSEEHTSELQSLMRTSYAVFCLTKKTYAIAKLQSQIVNTH